MASDIDILIFSEEGKICIEIRKINWARLYRVMEVLFKILDILFLHPKSKGHNSDEPS